MDLLIIKHFFYSNWGLFGILFIDFLIGINNSFFIKNLPTESFYKMSSFNSLTDNFTYLLLPLSTIALKYGKNDNKNISNLLKLNTYLAGGFSIISVFISYYKNNVSNNFFIHFYRIFTHSLLSTLNGYITGKGENKILLNFNIIYLFFIFVLNKVILYKNLDLYSIVILHGIPYLISSAYILSSINISKIDYSNKNSLFTDFKLELVLRNLMSIGNININNKIIFGMDKDQIKKYNYYSSNISSFLGLLNPISITIQKKNYHKKIMNKICFIYYLLIFIIFNSYLKYFNLDLLTPNLYLLLHYFVLINECTNISNNNYLKSIIGIMLLFIFKLFIYFNYEIKNYNSYYKYLIFCLSFRCITNLIKI